MKKDPSIQEYEFFYSPFLNPKTLVAFMGGRSSVRRSGRVLWLPR